jgi:hypothetical protein
MMAFCRTGERECSESYWSPWAACGCSASCSAAWWHWLARESDPQRYWQFVYFAPALLLALGFFLLRYRVHSFAGLRREKVNCAAFVLIFAGVALVLGKLSCLLLPLF